MNQLTEPQQIVHGDEESADFLQVLDTVVENKWTIAVVTIIFVIIGIGYALFAAPVYETSILVQVEDNPDTSAAKSLIGDVSSLFDVKSSAAAETQILASQLIVSRTVDSLHLYIQARPLRFPIIGDWVSRRNDGLSHPGIFGYGGFAWAQESIDVPVFNVPLRMEDSTFKLTILSMDRFRLEQSDLDAPIEGRLGVLQRFSTAKGVVELKVAGAQAQSGTTFVLVRKSRLETIADLQDALDVQEKIKQSDVVVASLRGNDPLLVSAILNEIGRQYIRQNVDRKSEEAAQSLAFLSTQLPELKRQLTESEQKLTKLRDQRGTVDLNEEAKLALLQSADARTRLLELQEKRHELVTRFADTHPSVVAIDRQIAALGSYRTSAEAQIKRLPELQQETVQIMTDLKVNTDLYTGLLNNVQQLQLVRAGKVGNVRLVDTALIPEIPVRPKKPLVVIASLLLGLIVGIGISIGRAILFHGISDSNEIERRLGMTVSAIVPLCEQQKVISRDISSSNAASLLLSTRFPNDPAVESIRSLRTAMQFALLEARNNVVVVGGPAPGIGKSFISSNLAAVLSMGGKRVLLIDADMRRGHLHETFGVARGAGLSDVIVHSASLADVVHSNVFDKLDFVSTGAIPQNPSELLLRPALKEILAECSRNYDIVLIDSPPILAVSDTATIAAFAGSTFIVARSGVTRLGEISEAAKRLSQNGINTNGVIFNGVNPKHGRYGYGSRYGSYRYAAYDYGNDR